MLKITEHRISFYDDSGLALIPVVQGDTGRVLKLTPTDAELTNSYTAKWFARKPSGLAVYYDATILSGSVYCQLTAQALAEKGDTFLNVRIYDQNEDVVSAFRVCLDVQESPVDAIESTNETNIFDQAIEDAKQEIGQILDTTLSIQNKAADAKATGDAIQGVIDSIIPLHSEDALYGSGDVCRYNGVIYVCCPVNGMIISGEFFEQDWIEVPSMSAYVERALNMLCEAIAKDYNTNITYNIGDYCFRHQSLYVCKEDGVTGAWNYSKWQAVSLPDIIKDQTVSISEDAEGFIVITIGGE